MGRPLPTGLDVALDSGQIAPFLSELVHDVRGPAVNVRDVTGEILKRRTLRYTVELDGAPDARWSLIGKVYETPTAGESGFSTQHWLWKQGFTALPPENIVVPRVLAFLPELQIVLQEEAGGRSLQRLLNNGQAGEEEVRLFAQVLVKLHSFPFRYGTPFTIDQHLAQRCAGLVSTLASKFPDLSAPIDRIVSTAREAQRHGFAEVCTLAHGDYHPGQIHIDDGRTWLVDLDLLHCGDPAYDVAMAVVKLRGMGARHGREKDFLALAEAFLETYFSQMDLSIARRVPHNAALIFLKRACKRFRWQDEADWHDAVRSQIRNAEECLAQTEPRQRARTLDDVVALCKRYPAAD